MFGKSSEILTNEHGQKESQCHTLVWNMYGEKKKYFFVTIYLCISQEGLYRLLCIWDQMLVIHILNKTIACHFTLSFKSDFLFLYVDALRVPVNNFSIISGKFFFVFSGLIQY